MLFTGDIESEVEKQLLESGVDLSADIYKAAHHGSITSNTKEFLDAVNPSVVLISSDNGNHNTFGHPVESFMEYLQERNIMVYRTDELDTVTLVIDGESFTSDTSSGDYRSGRSIVGVE
jgi:competence protein ComEC